MNSVKEPSILVIFNPHAFGGKSSQTLEKLLTFLKQNNAEYYVYQTAKHSNKQNVTTLFTLHNFKSISIVGGDGTINMAINSLPHLDIPIHIVPAGTGNDTAKMIYDSLEVEKIIPSALSQMSSKKIDVWRCNNQLFVNGFGVGFDGKLAHQMSKKKYLFQKAKYWLELINIIFSYKEYPIDLNGKIAESFMICIANGRVYGGGFHVAPQAIVDDGLLDIVAISEVSRINRLRYLPKIKNGKHLDLAIVSTSTNDKISIRAEQKMYAHLDGEPMISRHFDIKNEGQLQLLA